MSGTELFNKIYHLLQPSEQKKLFFSIDTSNQLSVFTTERPEVRMTFTLDEQPAEALKKIKNYLRGE
jgi:hypothetical protein